METKVYDIEKITMAQAWELLKNYFESRDHPVYDPQQI